MIGKEIDSRCNARGQNLCAVTGMQTGTQNPRAFPELIFIRYLRLWSWAKVRRKRWGVIT